MKISILRLVRRRLRDVRGYTLVELLMAGSLLVVVIALASGIMLSAINIYGKTALRDSAQQVGDAVYEFCEQRLVDAKALAIGGQGTTDGQTYLQVADGHIYFKDESLDSAMDFLGGALYNGLKARVTAVPQANQLLQLTVEVYSPRDGGVVYTRTSTLRLATMHRLGVEVDLVGVAADATTDATIYIQN